MRNKPLTGQQSPPSPLPRPPTGAMDETVPPEVETLYREYRRQPAGCLRAKHSVTCIISTTYD
ncbi:hypothetical protein BS78_02G150600 [Paspalum vaginatum]|nr:hypothetical protein BS78_02G150600 [Paspalum vaginatum]